MTKMIYYKDLTNNEVYGYDEIESQLPYIQQAIDNGWENISNEELDSIRKVAEQARLDAMTYSELRAAAYPSFADQFDTIFHGGLDAWKAEIQAVKTQFPKGE